MAFFRVDYSGGLFRVNYKDDILQRGLQEWPSSEWTTVVASSEWTTKMTFFRDDYKNGLLQSGLQWWHLQSRLQR